MKKFLTLALVGAVALGASSVVFANICAFDPVPAATLLFPFVEYDYSNAGATTSFAITNVSSEAQVVHVTLWTDYSVAILDFNILLTGYDVQTLNIAAILHDGVLPVTGGSHSHVGNTPNSDGPVSETNVLNGDWVDDVLADPESTSVLVCNDGDPADYVGGIPQTVLDLFEGWLKKSQGGATRAFSDDCDMNDPFPGAAGSAVTGTWWLDDAFNAGRPTWMYITADVATECNKAFPDATGYFTNFVSDDNVLMGDYFNLNPATGTSTALHAAHLEADEDLIDVATEGNFGFPVSFYARYSNADGVSDNREPLPTAWAFRYMDTSDDTMQTYIRAFKASTYTIHPIVPDLGVDVASENVSHFIASNCLAYTYYAWDEEENVTSVTDNPWSQPGGGRIVPNLLPLETQEVDVREFNLPGDFGWMLFVWPASNYDMMGAGPIPDLYQTWMGVRYDAAGIYSEGLDGLVMANYNCFCDQVLPNLGVNYNYIDDVTGDYVVSPCIVFN